MKTLKNTLLKLLGKLFLILFSFIAVTFVIYFFNLFLGFKSVYICHNHKYRYYSGQHTF